MTKYCVPGDIKCKKKKKKKNPEYTFYKISKKLETGPDKWDLNSLIYQPQPLQAKRCL